MTHEDGGRRLIVVGLGKRDELDGEKARVAAAGAAGRARELGTKSLSWAAPAGVAGAVVEGTLLKLYEFDRFKSKKDDEDDGDDDGLTVAGDRRRRRGRGRGRAPPRSPPRPEPRPRPAEPARQRGHARVPGRPRA